jgi:hypothetical protein
MFKPRFQLILLAALACAFVAPPAAAESQVRIVRLSDVQGAVQIDKNVGLGYESAFANLPIIQGTRLHTKENGRAEVEFEDGSTLRLTPNTTVEFCKLGTNDAGQRLSTLGLVNGRVYVNWLGKAGDEFNLNFSREKIALTHAAHFRVANSSSLAEVVSFKNDLEVAGPSETVKAEKKKMIAFDANDGDKSTEAKNFTPDTYDEWDKQSVEYHDQYAKNNATPMGYGASDLSYYGSYSNLPGYGAMWQPYFASAGWNPFMDGAWAWYPGLGYMWASAYPWGWTPYYYGNWTYVPNFGWGWQPGTGTVWRPGIHYVGAAPNFQPPVMPANTMSTVIVGKGGRASPKAPVLHTLVSTGSAGLGVPRGVYGGLRHLSSQAVKSRTGSVYLPVAPQFAAGSSPPASFGAAPMAGPTGHVSSAPSGHAPAGAGGHK